GGGQSRSPLVATGTVSSEGGFADVRRRGYVPSRSPADAPRSPAARLSLPPPASRIAPAKPALGQSRRDRVRCWWADSLQEAGLEEIAPWRGCGSRSQV